MEIQRNHSTHYVGSYTVQCVFLCSLPVSPLLFLLIFLLKSSRYRYSAHGSLDFPVYYKFYIKHIEKEDSTSCHCNPLADFGCIQHMSHPHSQWEKDFKNGHPQIFNFYYMVTVISWIKRKWRQRSDIGMRWEFLKMNLLTWSAQSFCKESRASGLCLQRGREIKIWQSRDFSHLVLNQLWCLFCLPQGFPTSLSGFG